MTTQLDTPPVSSIATETDTYALGRTEAESRRLVLQAQIYGRISREVFTAAGISRGMKVLDLGSGAGDVSLLLADLVGPEGRVVGIDSNAVILETARGRVHAAGWTNVELIQGDVRDPQVPSDFDAVVGRWVLMYLEDPVAVLRRARRHLRPGGVVAFIESEDLTAAVGTHPPSPVHEQLKAWVRPPSDAPGPIPDMGRRLRTTFVDAGLREPQLRLDAPIGGGPDWPGYSFVAETVRSLLPFLEQVGAVSAVEVDVDTLEERLRAEVVSNAGVQILPAVIGAWTRAH